ncbi:BamA/TamA family outer membrane protein [Algoriphagus sp. NG3]|uniref:BamA/TamA family outer membrane protein n=1 Tax=Algoriphagus sp. NG3 TaxID=3097546 RepID=UPI002A83FFF6|nr:BamA/TamA family outer membrane protein [Algoriphagus sp. NG3]WPR76556.1 BamA/TamA family outer membrane protein [Algoriphagus sp. NG3]
MEGINNYQTSIRFTTAWATLSAYMSVKSKFLFKHRRSRTLLPRHTLFACFLSFFKAFHPLVAQETGLPCDWINPVGHEINSDGHLLLKDNTTQTIYELTPDSSDQKAVVSIDQKTVVLFGPSSETQLYNLDKNSCTLIASIPVKTEYATFSQSGDQLFLLHSKTWRDISLTSYETQTGLPVSSRKVSSRANALTLNSNDSLVGISSGSLIKLMDATNLKTAKVFWEEKKQMHVVFSPVKPMQVASATPDGTIQIRDLQQDALLAEIKAHGEAINTLQFDPTGEFIFIQDEKYNLSVWDISNEKEALYRKNVEGNLVFDGSESIHWREGTELVTQGLSELTNSVQLDSGNSSLFPLENELPGFVFFPQPLVDWRPETGIQFGLSTSFSFFPKSLRKYPPALLPSSIVPKITYGPDGKQIFTSIESEVYSANGWNFNNKLKYNIRARNFYFGIGNLARRDDRVRYSNTVFSLKGDVIKHLNRALKVGLGYTIRHDSPLEFEENEAISEPGKAGGWLVGGGPVVQIDFRDDFVFPTKGSFLDTRLYFYNKSLGSNFQYKEALLDYRKYVPIRVGKIPKVLAFQAYSHLTFGRDVPFYQLPHITSDRLLRGMWRNLYIDRQSAYVQTEYRSYFSPSDTRFGYVLFLGAGDVADSFLKDWQPDIKLVYGAGYRQQLVPKLRLDFRIDFAISNEGDFGVFGGVGVAF